MRGNGTLVLVSDELLYVPWIPRRAVRIPLGRIRAVDTPRGFLGKTVGSRLLAITWVTADGVEDRIAWKVGDLDAWCTALRGRSAGAI